MLWLISLGAIDWTGFPASDLPRGRSPEWQGEQPSPKPRSIIIIPLVVVTCMCRGGNINNYSVGECSIIMCNTDQSAFSISHESPRNPS